MPNKDKLYCGYQGLCQQCIQFLYSSFVVSANIVNSVGRQADTHIM